MPRPGPPPKDPSLRARRNKDTTTPMGITFRKGKQPPLPDGVPVPWCAKTREWWATWGASPLAEHMMDVDWQILLDAALIHNDAWTTANLKSLGQLIAIEKDFGATFTARLKLRIIAEAADAAEDAGKKRRTSPRSPAPTKRNDPRNGLRAV